MTALTGAARPARHHPRHSGHAPLRTPAPGWVLLAVVLLSQAYLSVRLIHLGIASDDEGLYIYSGHQLIRELWHGGGSPYYETYFSGAPDLYPVLAAMADAVGGLVAVRLMSLVFMLAATALLYGAGRRVFGYWPGMAAAGLFACLGVTQFLGAYATYDAMSLMLVAVAGYCAVRASADSPAATRWLLLVPAALLAANAVKYASALFDPVVVGLAALLLLRRHDWRRVRQRAAALALATLVLGGIAVWLAGTAYLKGVLVTTLARPSGTAFFLRPAAAGVIAAESWGWIGAAVALSVAGILLAALRRREHQHVPLLTLLAAAGALVTAEGLRLHSLTSVNKHDTFGAWFASIAGGYALARGAELARSRAARTAIAAAAAAVVILAGVHYSPQAGGFFRGVNAPLPRIAAVRPYLVPGSRHYLIAYYAGLVYTSRVPVSWTQVSEHNYLRYPVPGQPGSYLAGAAGFRAAIRHHYFAVVSLASPDLHPWDSWEQLELRTVQETPGYELVSTAGGPTFIDIAQFRGRP